MLEMNYIDDKYEMLSTNLRPWFLVTDFRDGQASTSLKCLQHDENDDKRMLMTSLVVVGRCPPTQTPRQNLKIWFLTSSSQEIGSGLVSLEMIFQALQFELFRFKFHLLGSIKLLLIVCIAHFYFIAHEFIQKGSYKIGNLKVIWNFLNL